MEDFESKFKEFQVKLLEAMEARDSNAHITYSQSPQMGGIMVMIHSTKGVDKFLVSAFNGTADFVRVM